MPQNFESIQQSEALSVAYDKIASNDQTLRSGFAATDAFPSTFIEGQVYQGRFLIDHTDLSAAALTQTLDLGLTSVHARVESVRVYTTAAFTGGGAAAVAVEIGDAGDPDRYAASQSVFTGGALVTDYAPHVAAGGGISATTLQAKFTADVNVADLTAGSVQIIVNVRCLIA